MFGRHLGTHTTAESQTARGPLSTLAGCAVCWIFTIATNGLNGLLVCYLVMQSLFLFLLLKDHMKSLIPVEIYLSALS